MKGISGAKTFRLAFVAVMLSLILIPAGLAAIEVEEGDWIEIKYTISGAPSGTVLPQWIKIEFLTVAGTTATIRVTMHMSDGNEESDTMTVDVEAGGGSFGGLSGLVIPANCKVGDSIEMAGFGTMTIEGEKTGTYAGASRTVVYASLSQYGTELTYYWDKQTGVMVGASGTSGGMTVSAKVTDTNIWETEPLSGQWLWILAVVVIIVVVAVAGSAVLLLRRRKAPLPEVAPIPTE